MAQPQTRTVSEIAAATGTAISCAGNLPLLMDDPGRIWFVEQGTVEVFLLECADGVESSAPQHMLHAEQGRLLFGVAPMRDDGLSLGLVAKGLPGTELRELAADDLASLAPVELAAQADAWLTDLAALLTRDISSPPRPDVTLDPGESVRVKGLVGVRRGVVWATGLSSGTGLFMDLVDPAEFASLAPLAPSTWLTLAEETPLTGVSSEALARDGTLLPALRNFHDAALSLEALNRRLAIVDLANLDRTLLNSRRADEENARRQLFNLYGLRKTAGDDAGPDALFAAVRRLGDSEGIDFKFPIGTEETAPAKTIDAIADLSGVRARQVNLAAERRWWTGAGSAMLAFRASDGLPVTLLPGRLGRFRAASPDADSTAVVTAAYAETLRPDAWVFYRPLPPGSTGVRDLLRAGRGISNDVARFVIAGLLAGLATLLPAVVAGVIVDQVLPGKDMGLLYLTIGALVIVAVLQALLQVVQGLVLMRLEGRAVSAMEAAFWDRLLRLPLSFLQRYPAGDIAMRGSVFRTLRDNVLGTVVSAAVSLVFVIPIFALIVLYQDDSGLSAGAFGVAGIALTVILGLRQIEPQSRVFAMVRSLSGLLLQFVKGMPRFRVGNAERSAYAIWARGFLRQKRAELEVANVEVHSQAFQTAIPILPGAVLMLAVPTLGEGQATAGDFIVIYLLFAAFIAAYSRLSAVFAQLATLKPSLDLIRPFLAEAPEKTAQGQPVSELGGAISLDHVSYRYDADGPPILEDVSMEFHPGEFVAIAGASGAGKSTIFRLLLGLAQPDAGNVYYDGRDLRHLNLKQVRRQLGVVPQEARLYPQDLWDNIAGDDRDVTNADIQRAVSLADIKGEIDAMPMGPFTFVGVGALSGGESQRVRIARALVRNPRIILLDEATNALGNDSQARVMRNLARLSSTRIVIAHRLSTLREADRIYVLKAGQVTQHGTFEELTAVDGLFRNLVRRQMA
ncbi:MAG: ATP-binding cassette domain-containing protein [Gammaproteobacteria bacterium]|nr:ATP-binding cassette domain-containing protein [Gammaproteobacteria bacterium]